MDHLNFNQHENKEEFIKAIARFVYSNAPFDFVFALVCFYMFAPFVYCIDQDGF